MRSPGYRSQYESFRCVEFKYMQQFRQQEIRFFAPPPFCLPVFFRVCRKNCLLYTSVYPVEEFPVKDSGQPVQFLA